MSVRKGVFQWQGMLGCFSWESLLGTNIHSGPTPRGGDAALTLEAYCRATSAATTLFIVTDLASTKNWRCVGREGVSVDFQHKHLFTSTARQAGLRVRVDHLHLRPQLLPPQPPTSPLPSSTTSTSTFTRSSLVHRDCTLNSTVCKCRTGRHWKARWQPTCLDILPGRVRLPGLVYRLRRR